MNMEALVMTPHTTSRFNSITLVENLNNESIRPSYRGLYENVYFLFTDFPNQIDDFSSCFNISLASSFLPHEDKSFFGDTESNVLLLELANELFEGSVALQGRPRKILSETLRRTASKQPLIKGML